MPDILKVLAQNPPLVAMLGTILGIIFLSITLMYVVAFFQGREVSFYPPKIGERLVGNGQGTLMQQSRTTSQDQPALLETAHLTPITPVDVLIGPIAQADCDQISIPTEKVTAFIIDEALRHPALFRSTFSTVPLVFESNIIFLSWDGSHAVVERVLDRSDAYPTSNAWVSCVSLYRQATALPYRNRKERALLTEMELRHTVNLYKKLLKNVGLFIESNKDDPLKLADDFSIFQSLLDEAESSLFGENPDIGVVRLEALLSSIHTFLLLNAPQVKRKQTRATKHSSTPRLTGRGNKSILLVDDQLSVLEELEAILGSQDLYRIATARNGEEALKAMVENNYDLVVTDVVMPVVDGREVAIGAKVISPRTKVLVLTSFVETSKQAEMPFDHILLKDITRKEFLDCIRDMLEK